MGKSAEELLTEMVETTATIVEEADAKAHEAATAFRAGRFGEYLEREANAVLGERGERDDKRSAAD